MSTAHLESAWCRGLSREATARRWRISCKCISRGNIRQIAIHISFLALSGRVRAAVAAAAEVAVAGVREGGFTASRWGKARDTWTAVWKLDAAPALCRGPRKVMPPVTVTGVQKKRKKGTEVGPLNGTNKWICSLGDLSQQAFFFFCWCHCYKVDIYDSVCYFWRKAAFHRKLKAMHTVCLHTQGIPPEGRYLDTSTGPCGTLSNNCKLHNKIWRKKHGMLIYAEIS